MTRWNDATDRVTAVSPGITDETNALPARYFTDPDVWEMEKEKISLQPTRAARPWARSAPS